MDKYDYLTGEKILHPHQRRVIEQAKPTYSPLGKAFAKTNKSDWRSRRKTNKNNLRRWKRTT